MRPVINPGKKSSVRGSVHRCLFFSTMGKVIRRSNAELCQWGFDFTIISRT